MDAPEVLGFLAACLAAAIRECVKDWWEMRRARKPDLQPRFTSVQPIYPCSWCGSAHRLADAPLCRNCGHYAFRRREDCCCERCQRVRQDAADLAELEAEVRQRMKQTEIDALKTWCMED